MGIYKDPGHSFVPRTTHLFLKVGVGGFRGSEHLLESLQLGSVFGLHRGHRVLQVCLLLFQLSLQSKETRDRKSWTWFSYFYL